MSQKNIFCHLVFQPLFTVWSVTLNCLRPFFHAFYRFSFSLFIRILYSLPSTPPLLPYCSPSTNQLGNFTVTPLYPWCNNDLFKK